MLRNQREAVEASEVSFQKTGIAAADDMGPDVRSIIQRRKKTQELVCWNSEFWPRFKLPQGAIVI